MLFFPEIRHDSRCWQLLSFRGHGHTHIHTCLYHLVRTRRHTETSSICVPIAMSIPLHWEQPGFLSGEGPDVLCTLTWSIRCYFGTLTASSLRLIIWTSNYFSHVILCLVLQIYNCSKTVANIWDVCRYQFASMVPLEGRGWQSPIFKYYHWNCFYPPF